MEKLKWDKEYATNFLQELRFLESKGIKPCFTKTDDNGLKTFKFKKTPELFEMLRIFYTQK